MSLSLAVSFVLLSFLFGSSVSFPHSSLFTANETAVRSSLQSPVFDHIIFAADNTITLYVNGVQKLHLTDWNIIGYVQLNVNTGDVIALKVKDYGSWYGAIAQLSVNGRLFVTGRDNWLSIKASSSDTSLAWTKKDYPASRVCTWTHPVLRPNPLSIFPGKSPYFPDPTAARYVWDRYAGEKDTTYLRYRIGGETNGCAAHRPIHFAGDNFVHLYINGVLYSQSSRWETFKSVTATLRIGDVVSLKVEDAGSWYGAIATFQTYANQWYSTGRDDWRAIKAFPIPGDADAWMKPSYSACGWPKAVTRNPGSIVPGKAMAFPYSQTGAEYVWATNAGEQDTIFLRAVVGGKC